MAGIFESSEEIELVRLYAYKSRLRHIVCSVFAVSSKSGVDGKRLKRLNQANISVIKELFIVTDGD